MTANERYVRMIVRARQAQLVEQEREALTKLNQRETIPWRKVPGRIQTLVRRHVTLAREAAQVERAIKQAGFSTYHVRPGKPLAVDSSRHGQRKAAVQRDYAKRQEKIRTLSNQALVDVLGLKDAQAQPRLQQLVADLRLT